MTYLQKFGLQNFRIFKDMTDFEFAPITVLTGTNSSGKSSLIKALLLFKENIAKSFRSFSNESSSPLAQIEQLDFTGNEHKLASFESCINEAIKENNIVFKFPLDLGIGEETTLELYYKKSQRETSTSGILSAVKVQTLKEDTLLYDFNKGADSNWRFYINYLYIQSRVDVIAKKQAESLKIKQKDELKEQGKLSRWRELYRKKTKGNKLTDAEFNELSNLEEWHNRKLQDQPEDGTNKRMYCHNGIIFHQIANFFKSTPNINLDKYFAHDLFHFLCTRTIIDDKKEILRNISDNDVGYLKSKLDDSKNIVNKESVYDYLKKQTEIFTNALLQHLNRQNLSVTSLSELLQTLRIGEIHFYQFINEDAIDLELFDKDSIFNRIKHGKNTDTLEARFLHYIEKLIELQEPIYDVIKNPEKHSKINNQILSQINDQIFDQKINQKDLREIYSRIFTFLSTLIFQASYYQKNTDFKIAYEFICSNILNWGQEAFDAQTYFFKEIILKRFMQSVNEALLPLSNLYFSEAVRANTQRAYSYSSQGTGFSEVLQDFEKLVINEDDSEFIFVNKWLKEFGLGAELKVKHNREGVGIHVYIDGRPLADIGYGVTQFLPILLKIAIIANHSKDMYDDQNWADGYASSVLIIEEPETNLHPRLQALLADMFVDAAKKFHIQFIIETHSEYLIRKLQYLTANKDNEYSINPEDTVIYYFKNPFDLTQEDQLVKTITIDKYGGLSDSFGKGFYDEATTLKFDLIQLNKRQHN